MSQPKASHWRAWSQFYGIDKRQARRKRRRAIEGDIPCWSPDCELRGDRRHSLHFNRARGPFLAVRNR